MSNHRFEKGLSRILAEVDSALHERHVADASVSCLESETGATVSIKHLETNRSQAFTREEVEDSADAIGAAAAQHVRLLVGQFVT